MLLLLGLNTMKGQRFSWQDTDRVLAGLLSEQALVLDEKHEGFVVLGEAGEGGEERGEREVVLRFTPPLVQPIGEEVQTVEEYLASLREGLGLHQVLLLQAGAAALGMWQDGELRRHKAIKKYVVRGRGRAQPTHLKTRGKSRYGSRLRMQNARQLLVEVNEKLCEWESELEPELGTPRLRFRSCPVRLWPELFQVTPMPPFDKGEPFLKIPLHVHVPDFTELERVYRSLCHGQVRLLGPGA